MTVLKVYGVAWRKKFGRGWVDEHLFYSRKQAVTYGNIESTQMGMEGVKFEVRKFDLA